MKKTSLYVDPETDRALERRAAAEGLSKAELMRRVLNDALAGSIRPRPQGRGAFEGPSDLAGDVDRYLAESGFGER